ncbi:MAG: hypothetical protein WD768_22280 [Phycisphaeraceae bacterium]
MRNSPFTGTVLSLSLLILPACQALAQDAHKDHAKHAAHAAHAHSPAPAVKPADLPAPLFRGLSNNVFPVSTNSRLAQFYFDQGLMLAYGFNHAEAARSFKAAQKLDPDCAMAYWGEAYVLGPNINAPMFDEVVPQAWAAIQQAKKLKKGATAKEKALIDAMAARYVKEKVEDRSTLDAAYRDAMRIVAKRFPQDLDIQTMFAEACMTTMPWDYWVEDSKPKELTKEVIATLEAVLAKNAKHAGAIHFYIHAVEAGPTPEIAEPYADTLRDLVPDAGHLVHMPAHIYVRIGRWHDAVIANVKAVASDKSYVTQCQAQGFYPAGYYSHNMHFLWYATTMLGDSKSALDAAKMLSQHDHDTKASCHIPDVGFWAMVDRLTLVQFGRWDDILKMPEPKADTVLAQIAYHYCRGMALARTGKAQDADQHAATLRELVKSDAIKKLTTPTYPGETVASIFSIVLDGEIAWSMGEKKDAIAIMLKAAAAQDALPYMEPPYFYYPVRHTLGAMLLEDGRAAEAEKAYREDLKAFPNNGWSLFGLAKALEAQGKQDEAAKTAAQFKEAWQHADVKLKASRF